MSEQDGHYEAVWPRSEKTVQLAALANRLESLEGKKIAMLWDYLFRGDEIFPWIEDELSIRYPGISFLHYDEFGSTHGDQEHEIIAGLARKLTDLEVDAVISGMGC